MLCLANQPPKHPRVGRKAVGRVLEPLTCQRSAWVDKHLPDIKHAQWARGLLPQPRPKTSRVELVMGAAGYADDLVTARPLVQTYATRASGCGRDSLAAQSRHLLVAQTGWHVTSTTCLLQCSPKCHLRLCVQSNATRVYRSLLRMLSAAIVVPWTAVFV